MEPRTQPWLELLARAGHVARGLVYVVIGVLALGAASSSGGKTTDGRGALIEIVRAPFGRVLLVAMAMGLAGYAVWRFVQAALDVEHEGKSGKGIALRLGYAGIGLLHAGLAASAVRIALGRATTDGETQARHWTAVLLGQPFGPWLVGLAGAGIVAAGAYELYRAYGVTFCDQLRVAEMNPSERSWARLAGRLGLCAHAIVFGLIGAFLIMAGLGDDSSKARGLGGALGALAARPYGRFLLATVAIGLVAYGFYSFVEARFRRISTS